MVLSNEETKIAAAYERGRLEAAADARALRLMVQRMTIALAVSILDDPPGARDSDCDLINEAGALLERTKGRPAAPGAGS